MSTGVEIKSALEKKQSDLKKYIDNVNMTVDGDTVHIDPKDYKAIGELKKDIKEMMEVLNLDKDVKSWEQTVETPAVFANKSKEEIKDIASTVIDSDEFKDMMASGSLTMRGSVDFNTTDIASYGQKDIYSDLAAASRPRSLGTVVQQEATLPRMQLTSRIRDLFPKANTNANLIEYFKVVGFTENGGRGAAAPVKEYDSTPKTFGLKPHSNLTWSQDSAPIRTIAHWEAAHRNILADQPQLRSVINGELMYGLKLAEDNQLLNGDGTGDNILGLLNVPGIQNYTQAPTEQKSDAVRRAMTKSALAFFPATGVVMHPNDWEDIELQKASGDGQYMVAVNVAVGAQSKLWRVPVVETPALAEGTFLTGAFGAGVKLYDREAANIRIAEQHQDFFIRNAVVILCEERLGLVVSRPESVVRGTFTP